MVNFALEITGLQKRFGSRTALNGLDLFVPNGSVFGLVGPNGAGKTTAFSIIAGFLRPGGGHVNIMGKGPFSPLTHKGQVTLLPQDSRLPGNSLVLESLIYLARLQGLSSMEARRSAEELLDWVELSDRANTPIRTLSHGMMRRLSAAQTFLGSPDLVLLDEPTSGLDPKQVVNIRYLIRTRQGKQTIIVSSHVLSEIEAACDHVAFIENGRTTRQDSMESMIRRKHMVTYFLESNHLPLETLSSACPSMILKAPPDHSRLTVEFGDGELPADINRKILPILLENGVSILEIRMGSDLESEYLGSGETRKNEERGTRSEEKKDG